MHPESKRSHECLKLISNPVKGTARQMNLEAAAVRLNVFLFMIKQVCVSCTLVQGRIQDFGKGGGGVRVTVKY